VVALADEESPSLHMRVLRELAPELVHPYGQERSDRRVGPTTIRNVVPWTVVDIEPRSPTAATGHRGWRVGTW
jgi:hypothetical protein